MWEIRLRFIFTLVVFDTNSSLNCESGPVREEGKWIEMKEFLHLIPRAVHHDLQARHSRYSFHLLASLIEGHIAGELTS